jgi:bifunctional DNA-binding transcriptional regulator/antitoxin component of YhaV-PrlF toxin-antitoxin module
MKLTKAEEDEIDAGLERHFATLRKIIENPKDIDRLIREATDGGKRRTYRCKLTRDWRVTIPKPLRDELGFDKGFVFMDLVRDGIRIRKIRALDDALSGYLGEPGMKKGITLKGVRKALDRAGPKIMNEIYGVRSGTDGLVDRGEPVPKDELRKEIVRCVCGRRTIPRMYRRRGFDIRGAECARCKDGYLNGADSNRSLIFNKIANYVMDHIDIEDWMEVNARTKKELAQSRAEAKAGKIQSLGEVRKRLGLERGKP